MNGLCRFIYYKPLYRMQLDHKESSRSILTLSLKSEEFAELVHHKFTNVAVPLMRPSERETWSTCRWAWSGRYVCQIQSLETEAE